MFRKGGLCVFPFVYLWKMTDTFISFRINKKYSTISDKMWEVVWNMCWGQYPCPRKACKTRTRPTVENRKAACAFPVRHAGEKRGMFEWGLRGGRKWPPKNLHRGEEERPRVRGVEQRVGKVHSSRSSFACVCSCSGGVVRKHHLMAGGRLFIANTGTPRACLASLPSRTHRRTRTPKLAQYITVNNEKIHRPGWLARFWKDPFTWNSTVEQPCSWNGNYVSI